MEKYKSHEHIIILLKRYLEDDCDRRYKGPGSGMVAGIGGKPETITENSKL